MKKGKVFGKKQVVVATLISCLAAAVWLNMKYSSFDTSITGNNSSKNLGGTQFVDTTSNLGEAINTNTGVTTILSARKDRNDLRTKNVEDFKRIIEDSNADETLKSDAIKQLTEIADNISKEAAIETVIKSKGFNEALVIISDEDVTVIVSAENLLTSETLQIQDAVVSQTGIDLEKIKIITVK